MDNNIAGRVFRKLAIAQLRHPVLILLGALALSAAAVFYTVNNLGIQTSQKDLISPKERLIKLAENLNQFEQLDSFIVVIEGSNPARSLSFLQRLAPLIEKDNKNFRQAFYRIDPDSLKPWALLYLDRKDLTDLVDNLKENRELLYEISKKPTLVNFFNQVNNEMSSTIVGELFTGFLKGPSEEKEQPLDLEFLIRVLSEMNRYVNGGHRFVSPWDSLLTTKSMDITQEGYFWTKDKRYLLVFVTPVIKKEFAGTLESIEALRNYVAQVRTEFPDISAGVTGPEALNVDQMNTALGDMGLATFLAIFGLTVLFIIFRKSIRRPLFESFTLLIALSWSFGLTAFFIGHLNILSVTFAPLLLGLGIDFGAHWFARYQEEEGRYCASKEKMLIATMENVGPGILLAGAILAISFLPLTMTGFKGLAELGYICTMGMIVMTAASLVVLPSLIALFDRPKPRGNIFAGAGHIRPLIELTHRRVILILAVSGLALALAALQAKGVRFDLNMLHLQSPKVESVVWEHRLLESSDVSSIFGEMLAPSLEEVKELTDRMKDLATVARVESVLDLLPSDQRKKLRILRELKPVLAGVDFTVSAANPYRPVRLDELDDVLGRIRFKMLDTAQAGKDLRKQMNQVRALIDQIRVKIKSPETTAVQKNLGSFQFHLIRDLIEKLNTVRQNVNAKPMDVSDLPPALLERFTTGDKKYLIRIYPAGDVWDPRVLGNFVSELRSVNPDVVGDPVTLYVFTKEFRDSTVEASLLSVVVMFVFLLVVFRDLKSAFLALIPLLVGTVWTFGLMPPLKIDLNLANSIFLPLIVGAGVEYGVIIVYRWRQKEEDKPAGLVLPYSTAMGVILAGLSTTVGFGSLMVSSHHGIFSLGLLSTIGSFFVMVAAVVFLPALLKVTEIEKQAKEKSYG